VGHGADPVQDHEGFIDAAKPRTRRSRWAERDRGAKDQVLTVFMEKKTGAKFAYLPYKSGGEAATQLVGNHTQANVNNPSENLEVWRAGQVRALCVFDKERIAYKTKVTDTQSWNDIPTCKEQGSTWSTDAARHVPAGKVHARRSAFYVDLFKKLLQTPSTRTTWRSRR
jgi:tripartite-type tricarboxylate transporter receptor subunit TctC